MYISRTPPQIRDETSWKPRALAARAPETETWRCCCPCCDQHGQSADLTNKQGDLIWLNDINGIYNWLMISKFVQIIPKTMVYDTQIIYSFHGVYKPTNITGGGHIVRFWLRAKLCQVGEHSSKNYVVMLSMFINGNFRIRKWGYCTI